MQSPGKSEGARLAPEQSVHEAFQTILRTNFDILVSWEPVAYHRSDIEGVHQMRVSMRRMRSALTVFRKAVPRELTDAMGGEMRWSASEMGPARDLDVLIDEGLEVMAGRIPLEGGERKMMRAALRARDGAYEQVREMIDAERYRAFKRDFDVWVAEGGWFQGDLDARVRAGLMKRVPGFAAKVLTKRWTTVCASGARMGELTIGELHELRIECKKLRYAVEFFTTLFDPEGMKAFTQRLKGLQNVLGVMNDVSVTPGLVARLIEGRSDDGELVQYAGAIVGWRAREYEEVRGQLDQLWADFAQAATPWRG